MQVVYTQHECIRTTQVVYTLMNIYNYSSYIYSKDIWATQASYIHMNILTIQVIYIQGYVSTHELHKLCYTHI